MQYLSGLSYLWMVLFIMIIAGLAKDYNLFAPVFSYIKNTFRSNRIVVVMLSAIGGSLPISGRVTVSAGLLDTVAPRCGHGRHKFGIVDYLATHHYYIWSPLEKTVILSIAILGLSYSEWLYMIAPLLIVSLIFIFWYIWFQINEEDVEVVQSEFKLSAVTRNIGPLVLAVIAYAQGVSAVVSFGLLAGYYMLITQQWNPNKLRAYINWEVLIVVGVAIVVGNIFKSYEKEFQAIIENTAFDMNTVIGVIVVSAMGFVFSFLMGSSGKFIALAALMSQLYGIEYFVWFFAVDYVGYLISPTHKCVMVGNRYFGTPFGTYWKALSIWSILLLMSAGLITFVF